MRIIGLTGGIATGKSTVSRLAAARHIPIIDGDLLSRELTEPGGIALPSIRAAFGAGVFHPDDTLDRKALGQLIFADAAQRKRLDEIMQPLLKQLIQQRLDDLSAAGQPLCILDMALLHEAGLEGLCDAVWCTLCPEPLQISRIMRRDHVSHEAALQRIGSQLPTLTKAARANTVILTHTPATHMIQRVHQLLDREIKRSTEGSDVPHA